MKRPTAKQEEVYKGKPLAAEKLVVRWLKKQGYTILDSHKGKLRPKPYDIKAAIGGEKWIIDVKTGKKPGVNIDSIKKC
jgi:Holliday junction resolvase-like predicted endonuclease